MYQLIIEDKKELLMLEYTTFDDFLNSINISLEHKIYFEIPEEQNFSFSECKTIITLFMGHKIAELPKNKEEANSLLNSFLISHKIIKIGKFIPAK